MGGIALPRVEAISAKAKDGKIVIALTNIDPKRPADFAISLPGITTAKVQGQVLTAPKIDSVNTFQAPNTVTPKSISSPVKDGTLAITLAPASVMVLTLDR